MVLSSYRCVSKIRIKNDQYFITRRSCMYLLKNYVILKRKSFEIYFNVMAWNCFFLQWHGSWWTVEIFTVRISDPFASCWGSALLSMEWSKPPAWLAFTFSSAAVSCIPSTAIIMLCRRVIHFTLSSAVHTFASMGLFKILHFETHPLTPKAHSTMRLARDSL